MNAIILYTTNNYLIKNKNIAQIFMHLILFGHNNYWIIFIYLLTFKKKSLFSLDDLYHFGAIFVFVHAL
jgi:hypothetical protein